MERQEAVKRVSEKVLLLTGEQKPNSDTLAFYIEKLVTDILDYCHRDDFPDALVYTVVELVQKRLADAASAAAGMAGDTHGPLQSVKMDDTEFHFAVSSVDPAACLSELSFDAIKPKLKLYRKAVSWA
ncbi:hypothetical protein HF878_10255 [Selenomonas bovis]|uniref:Uncharacterized protein n=1 Tax=Selenomonas bovis TaxID=416586 RepID=A0A848B994_9FIRM|nr:hypothetical protein [Selenomonas bovis]